MTRLDLAWVRINAVLPDLDPYFLAARGLTLDWWMLCFNWSLIHIWFWLFIRVIFLLVLRWKLVKYAIMIIEKILVASGKPFYYLSKHASSVRLYETGDNLISDILCWSPQHLLKLCSWKSLNNDIFLFFLQFILLFEIDLTSLC